MPPGDGDETTSSYQLFFKKFSGVVKTTVANIQEGYREAEQNQIRTIKRAEKGQLMTGHPSTRLRVGEVALTDAEQGLTPLTASSSAITHGLRQRLAQESAEVAQQLTEEYRLILNLLNVREHRTALDLITGLFSSARRQESMETLSNRYWHGTHDYPPQEKLQQFVDKVERYQPMAKLSDEQEGKELQAAFKPLKDAARQLALALKLTPDVEYIHSQLARNPFLPSVHSLAFCRSSDKAGLDLVEQELALIAGYKEQSSLYFNDMGDLKHPLNIQQFNKHYDSLLFDVPYLSKLQKTYSQLRAMIADAKTEAELPKVHHADLTLAEHGAITIETLQQDITNIQSGLIKQTLAEYAAELVRKRNQRIEQKTREARAVAQKAERRFSEWQGQINRVDTYLSGIQHEDEVTFESDSHLFPENCELPPVSVVEEINGEIKAARETLADWPTAINCLKDNYELTSHVSLIKTMRNFVIEYRLDKEFEAKKLSADNFQALVNEYKSFLKDNWSAVESDCAPRTLEEEMGHWDLKLFFYKRTEDMRHEFASFFRRSYFKRNENYSWADLCKHIHGANKGFAFFGYHGGRSKRILRSMGWLDSNNKVSEAAPEELKKHMGVVEDFSHKKVAFN